MVLLDQPILAVEAVVLVLTDLALSQRVAQEALA
jgi:hypothetical protein